MMYACQGPGSEPLHYSHGDVCPYKDPFHAGSLLLLLVRPHVLDTTALYQDPKEE